MKHTLRQVFRSGKFVVGFSILVGMILIVIIYPMVIKDSPLGIIGQGTFFPPGIYVNTFDSVQAPTTYILNLDNAATKRIANRLGNDDRLAIFEWLVAYGIPEEDINIADTEQLLQQWTSNYDPSVTLPGMTLAKQRYYQRLSNSLSGLQNTSGLALATKDTSTGALIETGVVNPTDYVNVDEVANVKVLPLGTDNFGRDVLTELVKAIAVSLQIGLVAGLVATLIGLILGLVGGYIGGMIDDIIMFITNLFTVIPSLVLLILISFSIGQERRGPFTIAVVIGFTSWSGPPGRCEPR